MIFLIAVLGGLLTGLLLKGTLKNLMNLSLRLPWLLIVYFLIDAFLNSRYGTLLPLDPRIWVILLLSVQYGSLFTLILINHARWPLLLLGAGELANFLVIMANGGRMPVDTAHLPDSQHLSSLLEGRVPHYGALDAATRLPFLGDILYLPYPTPSLLSPGDVILWLGLFLLMVHAMLPAKITAKKELHPDG